MTLWIENLLHYCIQGSVIAAAGWVVSMVWRARDPRTRLLHWQLLLAAALLLPLFAPRERLAPEPAFVSFRTGPFVAAAPAPKSLMPEMETVIVWCLVLGASLFLLRLALGALRIYLYRRRSTSIAGPSPEADFRVSHEVSAPVTFGFLRPVILLPHYFEDLPIEQQRAICTHELIHVRRRDWLFALCEELLRAVLWFHPAVWPLLARIQLEREQVVDQAAVAVTGSRDAYLEALLAIAGLKSRIHFVPAPLFLRKRHLAQRVATVIKEVSPMNKKHMFLSLAASASAVLISGALISTVVPLRVAAQEQSLPPAGEGRTRSGPRLLYSVKAVYPPAAKLKRLEGSVVLELNIAANGLVTDARVIAGPEELRRSAMQAVLQWQFTAGDRATRAEVDVNFQLGPMTPPADRPTLGVLRSIEWDKVPDDLKARIAPRLPVKEGDVLTHDAPQEIRRAIAEVGPGLTANFSDYGVLTISPGPMQIRVGGNVQSTKIKSQVAPVYPPLAKQARIQGTVRMSVRIGKDGKVENVELINGHPLLAPNAVEAVKHWEYMTTLLNGNPVEVITQVDVNFTLNGEPPAPAAQ